MKKKSFRVLPFFFTFVLVFSSNVFSAKPVFVPADVVPSKGRATVTIPQRAVEVTPGVFSLGTSVKEGRTVDGYAFVHYKKGFGKPSGCNNDGKCQGWEDAGCGDCTGGGGEESSCYGYLSKGAKWRAVENYVVNASNSSGLGSAFVMNNLSFGVSKWESAAGTDVLGNGSLTSDTLEADLVQPDNQNEVYFADIDSPGAIGITIVWGVFRGAPNQRVLVEWDQVYDDYDFAWSDSGEAGKMDFENIATHELGHTVGMGDLYNAECSTQTMYGYADFGETMKRSLEAGDVYGVSELYK